MHIASVETCFNPLLVPLSNSHIGNLPRFPSQSHHPSHGTLPRVTQGIFCAGGCFSYRLTDMMKNDEWMLWIEKWWTNSFLQKGNVGKTHLLICLAFRSPWSRYLRHSPPPRSWLKSQVLWLQEIRNSTKKKLTEIMTEIRKLFLVLVNVVTSDCQEVNDKEVVAEIHDS